MSPSTGHFRLHTNVKPKVLAGRYELNSSIEGTPFSVREEHTHVHVDAPRFTMPPEQILSSFPPANAEGTFGDRLPQIVLKRRTLPWERNPFGGKTPVNTPWLALVVIAEGEGELSTPTPVADCVTKPSTLDFGERDVDQGLYLAVTESVVQKIFPCEQDLPLLTHVREVDVNDTELANGDDDGWLAVVLANRVPVRDIGSDTSVRYLACLVNLEGQLPALPPPLPPDDHFHWEVVEDWRVLTQVLPGVDQMAMGTGIPVTLGSVNQQLVRSADGGPDQVADAAGLDAEPGQAAVQLSPAATFQTAGPGIGASLDGGAAHVSTPKASQWSTITAEVTAAATDPDAARVVRDTMGQGWRSPISAYALDPVLRFPVLAHWSFTTTQGAAFDELMRELDVGLLGTLPEPPAKIPAPPPHPVTTEVIQTGHVHLGARTRRGDRTTAWYRGPCVPHPTLRDRPDDDGKLSIAHDADQLRRVVPDGGEDLALASGFEIGRLLALSQLSIVAALLRFRGEQFGYERVRQLVDVFTPFEGVLTQAGPDLSAFVSQTLLERLATKPDLTIGPRRPLADPGRPIDVSGDLDAVIATGLGLDLDVLRKTGSTIGMVAALSQTDVPVGREDEARLDDQTIEMLNGALQATLLDVVDMALPQTFDAAPAGARAAARRGRATAQAARAPDALDELLAAAPTYADPDPDEP